MADINKTVMDVIIDPNVGNQLMDMFYTDPDYFENTYHNKISLDVLNRFLDVVSSQRFLIPLLSCLLRYNIDENSIDNIAFEKIKAFALRFSRLGLLDDLAENRLAVYQMIEIDNMLNHSGDPAHGCYDVFCGLLFLYGTNDCFRANDLLKLLEGTVIPPYAIKSTYTEIVKPKIKDQKKIEVIEKFLAGQRIFHKN